MVHSSEAHFLADFFSEGDEGNTDNCGNLVEGFVFLVLSLVLSTEVQHLLDLENVTGAGVGAGLDHQFNKIGPLLVRNDLGSLHRGFSLVLLTKEQKAQPESKQT